MASQKVAFSCLPDSGCLHSLGLCRLPQLLALLPAVGTPRHLLDVGLHKTIQDNTIQDKTRQAARCV